MFGIRSPKWAAASEIHSRLMSGDAGICCPSPCGGQECLKTRLNKANAEAPWQRHYLLAKLITNTLVIQCSRAVATEDACVDAHKSKNFRLLHVDWFTQVFQCTARALFSAVTCDLDAMRGPHMVTWSMLAFKNVCIFLLELVCAVAHLRIVLQSLTTGMGRGMLILRRLGPLNDSC